MRKIHTLKCVNITNNHLVITWFLIESNKRPLQGDGVSSKFLKSQFSHNGENVM